MRTCIRLAIGALLVAPAALGAQQRVESRRGAVPEVSVRIAGTYASLRIVGTSVDSLIVTGNLPTEAKFEDFAGGKGQDPIQGAKVFVEMPTNQSAAAGALELRVPARARVWAKAGTANIEVTGVTGELDLNIVGGSIRVTSDPATLNIESMDGTVTIDGRSGWLRAKTAAGDIVMRGSSDDAAFTTVSGTITIGPARLERARIESVTGRIDFSGDAVNRGSVVFDSHSGPIDLRLDPKVGAEIEATSITGSIENLLTNTRPGSGREGRGQELGTTMGPGGARITIRTFKGPIRLARR
jgi:hypothetical protein